jgi:hypothetical protein
VRDPRKDPRPGDVLIDANGHKHVVMPLGPGCRLDLKAWRKAMKGAEVLHVAS